MTRVRCRLCHRYRACPTVLRRVLGKHDEGCELARALGWSFEDIIIGRWQRRSVRLSDYSLAFKILMETKGT